METFIEDKGLLLDTIYQMVADIQERLDKPQPMTLTVKEAAEYIGVSTETVRTWVHREDPQDRIPGFYVAARNSDTGAKPWGRYRIIADRIPEFLEREATR